MRDPVPWKNAAKLEDLRKLKDTSLFLRVHGRPVANEAALLIVPCERFMREMKRNQSNNAL